MQLLELSRAFLHEVQKFPVLFGLNFLETCEHKTSVGLADCWDSLDQPTIQRFRWSRGTMLPLSTQVCGFKPG